MYFCGNKKKMKKAIFKFKADFNRNGSLEGVFISTKEKVDILINGIVTVDFGEVLGKHSDVHCDITNKNLVFVCDNEEIVELFERHKLESGYNPFEYMVSGSTDWDDKIYYDTVGELVDYILTFS